MVLDAEGLAQLLGQPLAGAVRVRVLDERLPVKQHEEVRALLQLLGVPRLELVAAMHQPQLGRGRLLQLSRDVSGARVVLAHKEHRVALEPLAVVPPPAGSTAACLLRVV
eukprot:scaffold33274_cov69-Phaeocystis_antarctica.AAC.5